MAVFDSGETEIIEKRIGYVFKDKRLLEAAFVHPSYGNQYNTDNYQRLEFLGDALVGMVTAEYFFNQNKGADEGVLTQLRSAVASDSNQARISKALGLDAHVRFIGSAQKTPDSVIGDVIESLSAAVYLDSDLETAKRFILDTLIEGEAAKSVVRPRDYKSELNEYAGKRKIDIEYKTYAGKDCWVAEVIAGGRAVSKGKGPKKTDAEQEASNAALKALKNK